MPRPLGLTSLQILNATRDGHRYGLDLVLRTGLPSGTVYPTLARLLRAGLLRATWEDPEIGESEGRPRRRYYRLTAEGARALAEGAERVAGLAAELGGATP